MEDANKQPNSFGSGQQRGYHPRPYFYVQPPSQPYYLYQHWQLNNPYSHYGLPAGFNFGRPCMPPYQYMHYPGFVFPHAPVYPVDYRRMFEPRFHAPTWGDMPRPQQHQPQSHGRPEMACSEAQTDPSDTITKLIECLDKFRASELQGVDRELDSGVASQSSGIFSPGEEKKSEEQSHILPSAPHESHLESPATTFSDSTAAVYDGESSQRSLDMLSPQVCWSGGVEEEDLPLDSSSIHEECPEREQPAVDKCSLPLEVTDIQTDVSVAETSELKGEAKESTPSLTVSSCQPERSHAKSSDEVSKTEHPTASLHGAKAEVNFQILKLPFDSVLSPGAASLPSPSTPYYYNYLPIQATHERMSVLSPSLDELSSRDEMFSTDLDDMELYPKHVYADKRLAEAIGSSPQAAEEVGEVWLPGLKRCVCACCGKSLSKETSRGLVHSSKMYRDDAGDSEEEGRYGRGCEQPVRVVVRKHSAPRKTYPLPQRRPMKPWYKRGQYKEQSDTVEQEEGRNDCKQDAAEGEAAEVDGGMLQCRTCQDRLHREDLTTTDRSRWTEGDVIPRRRQAAPLQRQDTSPQWKVMYQRPKDDDHNDNEPLPPAHWERDMETATSTLQASFGLGPPGPGSPHGAQQSHQGPHQSVPGPSGAARPEEQHQKPFFYIQPSQPYVPMQSMQWPMAMPMPVSYNPYYGYPGLGYGLPLMPHYQANPYMEPPGFIVPHTHLHLTDYRRMLNPQYYQTMAYHARRFRYQHNSSSREMTTTEVQTEPLVATERTSTPSSNETESSSLLPDCSSSGYTPSVPTSQPLSPASAVQKGDHSPEQKDMVPPSTKRTPSNGSFVIETEEVRIECRTTPVGLQLLHAHETAEVSHSFSQDMVQCSSILQSHVLQDETLCMPADQSEQTLQVCPDILLVGTPSTGEKVPALEESRNQSDTLTAASSGSPEAACSKAMETRSEKDVSMTSKNLHFKVVHLPFDPKYLDELRKMESTVWSMEETLIASPDSLIPSGLAESHEETLAAVAEASVEMLLVREQALTKENIPVIEMPPLAEDELEDIVPAVEGEGDEMVSEAKICTMADVLEEPHMTERTHTAVLSSPPSNLQMLESSPLKADGSQRRQEMTVQDHQDTSFESLPAYLPSASWLSDFDNVYCCSNMPAAPQKQNQTLTTHGLDVPTRRRKLDLEYKEQPHIRKPKERYKPKGNTDRRSLSDHECCLSRNFNENMFNSYVSKRERLCSRCLAKRRMCTSASPGLDGRSLKRKAAPFQQWNDTLLPTCEACKSHTKGRLMRKGSNPDVRGPHHGHDTEGESSENSSCRAKWRGTNDRRHFTDLKRPLASKQNLEKCPTATYPKLREKNCMCNEHQPVAWERLRHCPHGNTIREIDENCAVPMALQDKWKNVDQMYLTHRWQTEKSWKDAVPDADGFKNEARSQYFNKHKKSQPHSQGTCRKDTRC